MEGLCGCVFVWLCSVLLDHNFNNVRLWCFMQTLCLRVPTWVECQEVVPQVVGRGTWTRCMFSSGNQQSVATGCWPSVSGSQGILDQLLQKWGPKCEDFKTGHLGASYPVGFFWLSGTRFSFLPTLPHLSISAIRPRCHAFRYVTCRIVGS